MNTAPTIELDVSSYESLSNQLINSRNAKAEPVQAEVQKEEVAAKEEPKEDVNNTKKYVFKKGDQTWEVDEDAEIEMMADKAQQRLQLREMKDRAAGDIAVKNRMHALAEEKKRVQGTFKEFSSLAKKDPLKALEYISNKAKETDSEFEYQNYLSALAEQAERVANMSDAERKAYHLEKKLETVEGDLSQTKRETLAREKSQEIISQFGVTESTFNQAVETVLNSEVLMEGVTDELGVFDVAKDLIIEAQAQAKAYQATQAINPKYANDQELIFSLSNVIKQNPDFTEEDIKDIVAGVIEPKAKQEASQRLSQKQRMSHSVDELKTQGMSDYQLLVQQLEEERLNKVKKR